MRKLILAASAALCATAANAAPEDAYGLWLVESGTAIVEVGPCGANACGKIAWLAEPKYADGSPKIDKQNPDASMQARPLCGMNMIGDFTQGGDQGGWVDGFIYDAKEGKTYNSIMHVTGEGALYVRGYVGIPLFGKSQTWTRVSDARGGC